MTLLETIWNTEGTEDEVVAETAEALATGALVLTGNFRGHETEIAEQVKG